MLLDRRNVLQLLIAGSVGLGCGLIPQVFSSRLFTLESTALGTNVMIKVFHDNEMVAKEAIAHGFAKLSQIEDIMSLYRPHSQISQLNQEGFLENPHPDLVSILRYSRLISEETQGLFDITIQPLYQAWFDAQKLRRLPTIEELNMARSLINYQNLEIFDDLIKFTQPKMKISLNGVAQGFAADKVLEVLKEYQIDNALINSGEIGSIGKNGRFNWMVGIENPRRLDHCLTKTPLENRFLATSGDYGTFFSSDYSLHHILNPKTGRSPEIFSSITVLAPSGLQADALSTAAFLLGWESSFSLISSLPQVEALFILKDGKIITTSGFPQI